MGRDEALLEAFAAELRARRNVMKLSQEELAFRASVNRTYIAKLELAQNQPTLSVLHRLAGALNHDLPEIIQATLKRYGRRPIEAELPSVPIT
jgi:transcriptional regulator with XRE-family HTH domain